MLRPRVSPNFVGFGVGLVLATIALFGLVGLLGERLPDIALRILALSVGFACLGTGVVAARRFFGQRKVRFKITSSEIRLEEMAVPAAEIARIVYGIERGEIHSRLGAAPVHTEDTAIEIHCTNGRTLRLLAMDQRVHLSPVLSAFERANPDVGVIPSDLARLDPKTVSYMVWGGLALVVLGAVAWVQLSDWQWRRDVARREAREEALKARGAGVFTMLKRLNVDATPRGLPQCPHFDGVPVVASNWQRWFTSKQSYADQPKDRPAGTELFQYLAGFGQSADTTPERLIDEGLAATRIAVLKPDGVVIVHRTADGAAECTMTDQEAASTRQDLALRAALDNFARGGNR